MVRGKNLAVEDEWVAGVDLDAFKADMDELKVELEVAQGPEHEAHFHKIRFYTELFAVLGTAAMYLPVQWLVAPVLLGIATTARWTMVGHHTCHGGYDWLKQPKFNRFQFAAGPWRRAIDWFDWMLPEAWNTEHNNLHHYHLGEATDPDLVESNLDFLRRLPIPQVLKRLAVAIMACVWKWWYYAPNTFKHLVHQRNPKLLEGSNSHEPWIITDLLFKQPLDFLAVFTEALLPYAAYKFGVYPLPWLVLGYDAYINALWCVVLADVVANMYSFVIIVTNHAGNDLYRFDTPCAPYSGDFYLRAVVSSANFATGTDAIDFAHGWLNYQIEHHCFPTLSMLSYQQSQPRVKALCDKHGIPYVQESVFKRLLQLVNVMVGASSMRLYPEGVCAPSKAGKARKVAVSASVCASVIDTSTRRSPRISKRRLGLTSE